MLKQNPYDKIAVVLEMRFFLNQIVYITVIPDAGRPVVGHKNVNRVRELLEPENLKVSDMIDAAF